MSQNALDNFGAYRKARELFALVVQDMQGLRQDPRCYRLIGQQVGSADSGPLSQPSSPALSKNGQFDKGCDKGRDQVFHPPGSWDSL